MNRSLPIALLACLVALCASSAAAAKPGAYDSSFGGDGRVLTDFRGLPDSASAIEQVRGKGFVAVGGTRVGGGGFDFGVARYRRDGLLDRRFGRGGLANAGFSTTGFVGESANDFVALPNGKLVVVGDTDVSDDAGDFGVVAFTAAGKLDRAFASGGTKRIDLGGSDYDPFVAEARDGGLILAGTTVERDAGGANFALVKLRRDGSLDRRFGDGGRVTTDIQGAEHVAGVEVRPDGRIIVGGETSPGVSAPDAYAVAAYAPNGDLVDSFGDGGVAQIEIEDGISGRDATDLVLDGPRIVLGGQTYRGPQPFELVRLLADGSPDPAFSQDGQVALSPSRGDGYLGAVTVQRDGRVLLVGDVFQSGAGSSTVLLRLRENGQPDASFGGDGEVFHRLAVTSYFDAALTRTGRLITAGRRGIERKKRDFALARFLLD